MSEKAIVVSWDGERVQGSVELDQRNTVDEEAMQFKYFLFEYSYKKSEFKKKRF